MKITRGEVKNMVKYLDRGVKSITLDNELNEKATNWLKSNGYKVEELPEIEAVMISKSETAESAAEADSEIKVGGTTYEG